MNIQEQSEQIKQEIKNNSQELNSKFISSNRDQITKIIENYLLYYGYADSLSAFAGTNNHISPKANMEIDTTDSKQDEIFTSAMASSLTFRKSK